MKKVLFATTALVLSAGVAAAEVSISGYARTGIDYQERRGDFATPENKTQVFGRLRMNIDASQSTDQDVDFGARFRLQWDQGSGSRGTGGALNAGNIWVRSNGLKVTVGNVSSAFDNSDLMYGSELGIQRRSFGNPSGEFFAYETSPYDAKDRLGIAAEYKFADFTGRLSYIDPDQRGRADIENLVGQKEELALSLTYKYNEWTFAGAAVMDGMGMDGNDQYFLGAAYKFNDLGTVGLNWNDNGGYGTGAAADRGQTFTLYGNYEVAPGTIVRGYVANNDADNGTTLNNGYMVVKSTDTAYGIGADYDLGGAMLAGGIERGYDKNVRADMGVRFDF